MKRPLLLKNQITKSPKPVTASLNYFPDLKTHLTSTEISLLQKIRSDLSNFSNEFNESRSFPFHLVPKLNEWKIQGSSIKGYGSAELSKLCSGLVHLELYRVDPSLGTFYAVHTGVACLSLALLGSED